MGLWMKCPGCHTNNPLSLQVCPQCGRSLNNLPPAERVYVIGPAAEPAPATVPAPAAQSVTRPQTAVPDAAPAVSQPAKQPKKPRRKKK
jgi:hypothetical protein